MRSSRYLLPLVFCSIIGVVAYFASTNLYTSVQKVKGKQIDDLDIIIKGIKELKFPPKDEELRHSFISQIQTIASHYNPEIDASIKYVWVLSARHSYRKTAMLSSPQNTNAFDKNDGFDRMNLGIEVARKITAKKCNKSADTITAADIIAHGPAIIYNGEEESNDVLKDVLAKSEIANYPKERFLIFDLPKDQVHTKGQFNSLRQEAEKGHVALGNSTVAIITHAYHWPRTSRVFGKIKGYDYFGPSTKLIAYLVDRQFQAPGAKVELEQEVMKLPSYVEKGFILRETNPDTPYNGAAR